MDEQCFFLYFFHLSLRGLVRVEVEFDALNLVDATINSGVVIHFELGSVLESGISFRFVYVFRDANKAAHNLAVYAWSSKLLET